MTGMDRIAGYLLLHGGKGFCDDCLSVALDVPLPQVQEAMIALAEKGWCKRSDGLCSNCHRHKLASRRRTSSYAS